MGAFALCKVISGTTMTLISARSKGSSRFCLVCLRLSFRLTIEHLKNLNFFLLDPAAPGIPLRSWELLLHSFGTGGYRLPLSEPGSHREYFLPVVCQSVVTLIIGTTRVFYPSLGYQITVLNYNLGIA